MDERRQRVLKHTVIAAVAGVAVGTLVATGFSLVGIATAVGAVLGGVVGLRLLRART